METNINYEFTHLQKVLIAFIADFEKKIQYVYPKIPVVLENIDDSLILLKKYTENELKEIYNKLPRIVIGIQDVTAQQEQNTTQFLKMIYSYKEKNYSTQFRRISTSFTLEIIFVCQNFISGLSNMEFMLSILGIDNAFTYLHLGNNFQASYFMQNSPTIEKGQLNNSTSESKNTLLKTTIELNTQPCYINYNLISESDINFIIDTNIIDINNDNSGSPYTNENGEIINSKINTQQEFNDISSLNDEKNLLKNRNRVKKTNSIFQITSNNLDNDNPNNSFLINSTTENTENND